MTMHAVVSVLDEKHSEMVQALWDDLELSCALNAVNQVPIPHFSWHIAEDYNFQELENHLEEIVGQINPFHVKTTGLGVFTGEAPVVYIAVIKDPNLVNLHEKIWGQTNEFGSGLSEHYVPESWMPHITLANRDVSVGDLDCVMNVLGGRVYNWDILIDNLTIVFHEEGKVGEIRKKFNLSA
ncbi:MAG: 2'-5' RNA ligase family protein [Chloroflexi bacterium]|nr:2'-5' RNA ligase family protein [Chloroflexota bacterium]